MYGDACWVIIVSTSSQQWIVLILVIDRNFVAHTMNHSFGAIGAALSFSFLMFYWHTFFLMEYCTNYARKECIDSMGFMM